MKLSEIKAVAEVVKEETSLEYGEFMSEDSQGLPNLPVGSMLYSAEQMQEFMFKNVSIALAAHELYEAEVCGFHLSQLEKEEIGKIIQELFMEDAKNDS
ncbi:hypothetical protein [Lactococcus lactis]|uniref:hypothetical protein n=1 Tax=Lactococcus lactis TaxID=1358 RepID=UPI0022E80AFF|nr:hypothetical protein [Lactococcus lactis]